MKYLKKFENLDEPQVGDYVVCSVIITTGVKDELIKYMNNNIGKIIKKEDRTKQQYYVYYEYYENAPVDLFVRYISENYWWFDKNEILYYSKNKEECEVYLDTKKYNI